MIDACPECKGYLVVSLYTDKISRTHPLEILRLRVLECGGCRHLWLEYHRESTPTPESED